MQMNTRQSNIDPYRGIISSEIRPPNTTMATPGSARDARDDHGGWTPDLHDFEFEGYTHCGRKFEGNISLIVLELSYQTGDMRRLTQNEGLRALGMLQVGTTQTVVARAMNVS